MQKQENTAIQSLDAKNQDATPIVFYKDDKKFYFVYKKTEKLISAIFLVTSFFEGSEPLRFKLREASIGLLKDELDLVQEVGTNSVESHERIRKNILHIVSLLQAGFYAGLVSQMNFNVLRGEFMNLVEKLNETPKKEEEKATFNETFFDVDENVDTKEAGDHARAISVGETKNTSLGGVTREDISKGHLKRHIQKPQSKSDRQAVIVDIIRRKKRVSIKDITSEISGCSEKTIQRELTSLVEQGVLNKEGERRWSRYVVA